MAPLAEWSGGVKFFATGAPLAVDGPDADTTKVDMLSQPASAAVTTNDLSPSSPLLAAYLYWGGSVTESNCVQTIDDTVDFTAPGGTPKAVKADVCYCSSAGAVSYDVQLCRAKVTGLVSSTIGSYTVDKFAALINNGSTNNASFSVVLVVRELGATPRRIALWDGLLTMSASVNQVQQFTLGNIEIDSPPEGDLTFYALEGDVGGSAGEEVSVKGQPAGKALILQDAINPAGNPMNHTINTTVPPQTGTLGVDIDKFDISGALTPGDVAVAQTYKAGNDKWWLVYNIVGVNVYEPVFTATSTKSWELFTDLNNDGIVNPGDALRYTIHLDNTGSAPGLVDVTDPIPPEAASWVLVDAAGGMDASTATTLFVNGVAVPANASADVIFDMVVADVPDETPVENAASYDASPDGDKGKAFATDAIVRRDGDGDSVYDNQDNCPMTANPLQEDADKDGIGDVCDNGSAGVGGSGGASGAGGLGGVGGTPLPAAATAGVGGSVSGGMGGAGHSGGGAGSGAVATDASCGCRVARPRHMSLWWFAIALLAPLRRRWR